MAKRSDLIGALSGHFAPSEWDWLQQQPEFRLALDDLKSWKELMRLFDLGDSLLNRQKQRQL
jgi:hypothetical protein